MTTAAEHYTASIDTTIAALHAKLPAELLAPQVGIVCGSGLSTLAEKSLRNIVEVPYAALPGFGESAVPGHKSVLAFGFIGAGKGTPAVAMLGRRIHAAHSHRIAVHPYEGHPMHVVTYPMRLMAKLGVKNMIITNAAGGLNPDFDVGTIVAIKDHIALPNLTGFNPLLGPPTHPHPHPRFLPVSNAHSRALRRLAFLAAHRLDITASGSRLEEGTYAWVSGPTYETMAEGKFLRAAGGDVVGMSTIPEVVVARDEGMEVIVLSLVTNKVILEQPKGSLSVKEELAGRPISKDVEVTVSHDEVLQMGKAKAEVMRQLVEEICTMLAA
ncbi:inosine guanosine and [Exidia glandulosa HHB12029]|uniref:Purine nucleoside phosphorylase n=1 Tax=Exidia glandulosa HHB12029 TaxID=1314781 RepID=A0A165K9E4_EXIGL|nr:inosine guanosine and [Exidia glandulosa HHB12029]